MKKIFILITIVFVCIGCVYKYSLIEVVPEHQFGKSYSIGKEEKVAVGNPIVSVENIYYRTTFTPKFEYLPPKQSTFSAYKGKGEKLVPGQIWVVKGTIENTDGYVLENPSYSLMIHIRPDGKIGLGYVYEDLIPVLQGTWTKEVLFERGNNNAEEKGSFRMEFLYTGITGNTVRLTYREYIDDLARPAFYQDLTYDMTESKTIMFKTLKIKIIESTNSYLKYIVEDDGGLPWIPKK